MSAARFRTGLFFAALPFRTQLYRSGGWPRIEPQEDPLVHYHEPLRRHFTRRELVDALDRADRYLEESWKTETQTILNSDASYPPLLTQIYDPPPVLFCNGRMLNEKDFFISAVGTRYPDRIAIDAVDRFVEHLAETSSIHAVIEQCVAGAVFPGNQYELFREPSLQVGPAMGIPVTVSGFAFGVDERVHRASIHQSIPTVAVLGSGIDRITPSTNRYLIEEALNLQSDLSFISEFFPDEQPRRFAYPRRNRIIAGMATICVVFQAGLRSGALITARFALDEGREVVAFDHPELLGSGKNEGSRALLAEGANRLTVLDV